MNKYLYEKKKLACSDEDGENETHITSKSNISNTNLTNEKKVTKLPPKQVPYGYD